MSALLQIEEWLSTQSEVARTTFAKAIIGVWTLALPLLLSLSGLSTANKLLGSILWASLTLNLFLLVRVCWHRTQRRQHEADLAKTPKPPELDEFDHKVLIELIACDVGCGVDLIAKKSGRASFEVSRSMDKLLVWGFIDKVRDFTASGAEYRANAKGREHCFNPPAKR